MKILAIETSCDETAISIVEAEGDLNNTSFTVLGNALLSQVKLHREYGGVYPSLAKREHARNLVPLLNQALSEAGLLEQALAPLSQDHMATLKELLEREPELFVLLIAFLSNTKKPTDIDALAVTVGPGLEPALWVGINFAKALSIIWDIPPIPANHMEGHVLSSLIRNDEIMQIELPALALLISGGHTQLVLMKKWGAYTVLGETRDDAVGEAFDKVARMLELPYPGGPEISKLAARAREENLEKPFTLPRPMIDSNDFDFSFSGLKTAVLLLVKGLKEKQQELSDTEKMQIAHEFEDAAAEVLLKKTLRAIDEYGIRTFLLGGGVSANAHIRYMLETHLERTHSNVEVHIPPTELTGDNAIMVAASAYLRHSLGKKNPKMETIVADGTLSLK